MIVLIPGFRLAIFHGERALCPSVSLFDGRPGSQILLRYEGNTSALTESETACATPRPRPRGGVVARVHGLSFSAPRGCAPELDGLAAACTRAHGSGVRLRMGGLLCQAHRRPQFQIPSSPSSQVKGVTYCGESKASPLTIKNCPFHEQARRFTPQPLCLQTSASIAQSTSSAFGKACICLPRGIRLFRDTVGTLRCMRSSWQAFPSLS
eukprot:6177680-Pleurochrysis_carterae.AAC.2